MVRFRRLAVTGLAVWLLALSCWGAPRPNTMHIIYAYPAGGKQGGSVEVTVGGQFLAGVSGAHVTGEGVQASVLELQKPISRKEHDRLKMELEQLLERRKDSLKGERAGKKKGARAQPAQWTQADEARVNELRKQINLFVRRPANPAISELVTLKITMAADAPPGQRELRITSPAAVSNPVEFFVGQLPEYTEAASKVIAEQKSQVAKTTYAPKSRKTATESRISLPATINGQILPGEVDRYRFTARAGQQLVVAAKARELIPYIADAVPGWFQATLALYDAKGRELAYDDDYRFNPDPVLFYRIPAFGEYVVEIKDSIYRGREDFIYRVTIGEVPFVTSIFPLGGRVGEKTTVKVSGWNLPAATLTPDGRGKPPGIYPVCVSKDGEASNFVPFALDTLPDSREREPNDSPEQAQEVQLPIIINGRIEKPEDTDVFRFEGHAGEEIVAEVHARRLNSPLDSILTLTDSTGKQLAINDDCEDPGAGLETHHADSYIRFTLPASGTYYVRLADTQHQGGPEFGYRLRLSAPQPDFDLRVVPSSINARAGATVPLTIYALRRDGFAGEIAIALKNAPAGFKLSGARVPAGQDKAELTLTVASSAQGDPFTLNLEGSTVIGGQSVVRAAVPAEDMMQAFLWRHLVPVRELRVAVAGKVSGKSATAKILGEMPVRIPAGGTATIQVSGPASAFAGRAHLELDNAPEGIAIKTVSPSRDGMEIVVGSDAEKVKPGLKGNLIVVASTGSTTPAPKGKKKKTNARASATLPAIPFEIVRQ